MEQEGELTTTADKLDAMAHSYDDVHVLDNRLMHEWYPQRVIEFARGESLLELGLGHGHSTSIFSKHFKRYQVVEGSAEMIRRFQDKFNLPNVDIRQGFFETFETDERFDHLGMGFILEHVDDPALILKRYLRFLNPGGTLFAAVPNCESLHRRIGHAAGMLPDMTVLSDGDRQFGHQRYFSLKTFVDLLQDCGYEVLKAEGIFLKPVTTGQLLSLNLSPELLQGLMKVGQQYPELSNSILLHARPRFS